MLATAIVALTFAPSATDKAIRNNKTNPSIESFGSRRDLFYQSMLIN